MNARAPKQLFGYAACAVIAIGCFLPFKHVLYRDVTAIAAGPGIVLLVLALIAAALTSMRRYVGASFCAAAIFVLLGLQYAMMLRVNAISSIFWSATTGGSSGNSPVSPVGLDVRPDAGFWVIAIGAAALVVSALYRRGNAAVQHAGGGAYAVPERNGHAAIGEREFDRTDRTQ